MTALMVERQSEREEALSFLIYSSATLQKLTATTGFLFEIVLLLPSTNYIIIYINKHSGPLYVFNLKLTVRFIVEQNLNFGR